MITMNYDKLLSLPGTITMITGDYDDYGRYDDISILIKGYVYFIVIRRNYSRIVSIVIIVIPRGTS